MEIGHIFSIDGEEYCICDIKIYANHKFAYTTSGENEETKFKFFELIDDANGTLIKEVISDDLIVELIPLFL